MCTSIAQKYWPQVRIVTSCSSVRAAHQYLPGGTATLITGNLTGRIVHTESDKDLGRWNHVRIRGNQGVFVSIITAYMVCKSSISTTGPTTAFRQQYSILRARGITNPNPRQQFITDFQEFIQEQRDAGDRIILLGDFNTDLDNPQDSRLLKAMLSELHLTDIMGHHHPNLPPANTRQNGNRIDAIFACSTITPLIRRCGQGIFGSVVDSDHRPLYLVIPCVLVHLDSRSVRLKTL